MRLAYQFQGQTVKGQGWRRAGAYRVGRTRRPHCLFVLPRHHQDAGTCGVAAAGQNDSSSKSFCAILRRVARRSLNELEYPVRRQWVIELWLRRSVIIRSLCISSCPPPTSFLSRRQFTRGLFVVCVTFSVLRGPCSSGIIFHVVTNRL